MKNSDQTEREILREIGMLEPEMQSAVRWLVQNLKPIEGIADAGEILKSDLRKIICAAEERNDYYALVMALYKQERDKKPK